MDRRTRCGWLGDWRDRGAGGFELANITLTDGVYIPGDLPQAAALLSRWAELSSRAAESVPEQGWAQRRLELRKAGFVAPEAPNE